jgi:ABC-type uncharacterized transport system substrate-binding protein
MWQVLRRLGLGAGAILAAAAVLLLSDYRARRPPQARARAPRVAVLQHASQAIIDEGFSGVLAGLAEAGYTQPDRVELVRFNAEGDVATAGTIAHAIADGGYDLAITLTTPSLQALANANKQGRVRHIFGMVTDPSASGVGIGQDPLDHAPHLCGVGTMQPVAQSLEMALLLFPNLKRLGVVWNPAEINSEITTRMCRDACQLLKLELLEANAENSAAVREAASSLIARGAEALWVGGDVTVLSAIETVVGVARDAHIPVCTCIPGNAAKGTLFDLGADYFEVGRRTGALAGRALSGESLAGIPIERFVPPRLQINVTALFGLRDGWSVPESIRESADLLIDEHGSHEREPAASTKKASAPPAGSSRGKWKLRLLEYVRLDDVDQAERGLLDALRDARLQEGVDFELKVSNALGDMATLNGMVDAALTEQADLIVTLSTPTLQAAMRRVGDVPIVFTFLANPVAAGAGQGETDHHPNVTGSYGAGDMAGVVALVRELLPGATRVGALYCPAEVNSVYNHELFVEAAKAAGLAVRSSGVNTPAEVADAALALCAEPIDALCLPTANITAASFPSIIQAANRAKRPVFGFLSSLVEQGAVAVVARDYYDMGRDAGELAAAVMRGASPGKLPWKQSKRTRLMLNRAAAARHGIVFPARVLARADRVVEE